MCSLSKEQSILSRETILVTLSWQTALSVVANGENDSQA